MILIIWICVSSKLLLKYHLFNEAVYPIELYDPHPYFGIAMMHKMFFKESTKTKQKQHDSCRYIICSELTGIV